MKITVKVWIVVCSFFLFTSNQALPEPVNSPSPITKTTNGKTYLNELFEMSVEKPEGWYAIPSEELLAAIKMGNDILAGDDKNLRAYFDSSVKNSITIFSFSEVPPGTPGKINPSVISVGENIKILPGIKNGCDYISNTKEAIKTSQFSIDFEDKCESKFLNGTEFKMVNAQINVGSQSVKQRYFAYVKNGYAISVVQTYFDAQSEAKVNQVVNTIKIKP
jgi:hypothetical protein